MTAAQPAINFSSGLPMQFSHPTDSANSSSFPYVPFDLDSTTIDDHSRNQQAASGQNRATQQPRLHASDRSGTPLISNDNARPPGDRAWAIRVLNEQLQSLRATSPLDLKQASQFFDAVKTSEQGKS